MELFSATADSIRKVGKMAPSPKEPTSAEGRNECFEIISQVEIHIS
jgi:hypothetical protein